MRLMLLSAGSSIHTVRWAQALASADIEVHLATQHPLIEPVGENVTVHFLPWKRMPGYYLNVGPARRLINKLKPDLLNAHYASGYGTTARLLGFHPYVLSVWGSDIFEFPNRGVLHRWLLRRNIRAADLVASTSHAMAAELKRLVRIPREVPIVPYGVDTELFRPGSRRVADPESGDEIVIGTIKGLAPQYGVDILIKAFSSLRTSLAQTYPEVAGRLRLRIVGEGPDRINLMNLVQRRGIADVTTFVGRIRHEDVPHELQKLAIYVALSRSESFGVAVIEAGACGIPVVVSDVGGLPEVVQHEITGLVVRSECPGEAARALEKLVMNPRLRMKLGTEAITNVKQRYCWKTCVESMIDVYKYALS